MINFDMECERGHRFEGCFKDYEAFDRQVKDRMISCPLCGSSGVKRLFSGCSIQSRPVSRREGFAATRGFFDMLRMMRQYVQENYEYVGNDFSDVARGIHYGAEEERNVYGEATLQEMKELADEGIGVLPLPDLEKLEN